MVTGDFSITAAAIATQIGIFSSSQYDTLAEMRSKKKPMSGDVQQVPKEGGIFQFDPVYKSLLMSGCDLEQLEDVDWRQITKYEEVVFARTTPSQKLRVVEEFKKDKNVVAVTGDGVNDSPALKVKFN